jgi:hypothetical protein
VAAAQVFNVSSGSAGTLTVNTAVAGSQPASKTVSSTTYSLLTFGRTRITARLNSPMPPGTTLYLTLAAPSGATNHGPVVLTTTAQDLVTNIPFLTSKSGLSITYEFEATAAAGVVPMQTRTITLTLQ